ncbi:MAG: GntR family transcriptional regulator [Anaerolineae bacterium]|nr:GntR family transcriptional regulator [Anaerolineae bacterium]
MTINRDSPLPLYYQLKRLLLAKIESGELKPGDIFPTEQIIQETYEVSRTTVRQALSELEEDGKITRHRGRGTFVAKPKVKHIPEQYPDLTDHMTLQGLVPGWRLLSAEWVFPSMEVGKQLQVDEEQRVFRLERLRLEHDEAIGYHIAHVAPDYAGSIDEHAFTTGGSLRYLRPLPALETAVADRMIDALPASEHVAKMLDVSPGEPLLRVQRVIRTPEGSPIEAFSRVYRGDRFQYHIQNMRAVNGINA